MEGLEPLGGTLQNERYFEVMKQDPVGYGKAGKNTHDVQFVLLRSTTPFSECRHLVQQIRGCHEVFVDSDYDIVSNNSCGWWRGDDEESSQWVKCVGSEREREWAVLDGEGLSFCWLNLSLSFCWLNVKPFVLCFKGNFLGKGGV